MSTATTPAARQRPLGTGFGAATTAAEALAGIDLGGRTALVTGGYSGLGLAATRALVAAGARVIVPALRPVAARAALAGLRGVEIAPIDLADPSSIRAFAEQLLHTGARLELLIAAAGIMAAPEQRTPQGWELQFAVNHLGHFALVNLLARALEGARVVAVSSGAHGITGIRWQDPHFVQEAYDPWQAYGQSKTANALFAVQLAALGADRGLRAYALHPGSILTPLQRHIPIAEQRAMGWIDAEGRAGAGFKTPEQGAATMVWAGTAAALDDRSGAYCEDCDVAPLAAAPGEPGVRSWAVDPEAAERLWAFSAELTGVDGFG